MTTTSDQLEGLAAAQLLNATDAGPRVFTPDDWPTWNKSYPALLVQAHDENRESMGRGTPMFTVTTTIRVTGRTQALGLVGDLGAAAARVAMWRLKRQCEILIVNCDTIMPLLQQVAFTRTKTGASAEGEANIAEFAMDFGLEYVQGPEDFFQTALTDVTSFKETWALRQDPRLDP